MTASGETGKKARREHAREVARREREVERRRTKRNKIFLQGGIIVAVLATVAVIAIVITQSAAPAGAGPRNMASDGILFTGNDGAATPVATAAIKEGGTPTDTDLDDYADMVNIVTYIDYACPACQAFEQTNAEQIAGWVADSTATLEVHPIAILDRMSLGAKYSSRAANAAACVANFEPDRYLDVSEALFAGQPAENTTGLDTDALTALVAGAGSTDGQVTSCIDEDTFGDWVDAATQRSSDGPLANTDVAAIDSTPTVLVNGQRYVGSITNAEEFAAFVENAASQQ